MFFWLASAEGTALANDVRKNTTFSNNYDTGITGTLDLSLLISSNIRAGITIDGITGDSNIVDTSTGTVTSNAQILNGYKCYSKGVLYTGNIPSKGSQTYTPTTSNQTIALGQYLSGIQTILGDSDLKASNIISTANIFNIQGTATINSLGGAQVVSGSAYRSNSSVTVLLPFTPNVVITVSDDGKYVNIRQTIFSWYYTDVFFYNDTPTNITNWHKYTSSEQAGNSGNPCITIGTNGFTWQAIGGYGNTINYVAFRI